MRELVRLVEEPRTCSYLPHEVASLEYRIVQDIAGEEYEQLLARGYRRFGRQLFRPHCGDCEQCVSVRVLRDEFRPSASQRRVLRRNSHIRAVRERVYVTGAHVELYNRYHGYMAEIRGWRPDKISRADYVDSFVSGGGDFARQWMFFEDERLVGVSLVDETPEAVSLVYAFHEPERRSESPGAFAILKQLEHAQAAGKRYAYPGYWIPNNQSMAYKSRYRPFERLVRHPAPGEKPRWVLHDEAGAAVDPAPARVAL